MGFRICYAAVGDTCFDAPEFDTKRHSRRVTNYKSADMALRWTAAGFLEAETSFRKLRGFAQLKSLISGLRPQAPVLRKAAQFP